MSDHSINRIIDANINRAKEGLRVCEELARFILNDRSLTLELKGLRHRIDPVVLEIASRSELLKERFAQADVGKNILDFELKRESLKDIFFANIQRVKESIRVLEELSKLVNINSAIKFKQLRYRVYAVERKIAPKIEKLKR